MNYRLLGPLEVIADDGEAIALSGDRERVILATLALGINQVVTASRLIDALWGDDPPATASNSLQVHVSKLRKKLRAAAGEKIESVPHGYVLRARPDQVDLNCFERMIEGATGDPAEVSKRLADALALWRGPTLADVDSDLLRGDKTRVDELRRVALERRIEADLTLGRHLDLVGELEALVHADPLREGPRRLLMIALYRSGRQAAALAVYKQGRELLAEELGIDPSSELQALEVAILRQDPKIAAPESQSASAQKMAIPSVPSGTITLLMSDIEGSTRLWEQHPDAMALTLRRHDELMRTAIEGAGGYVFKAVGDSFCAAFATASDAILAASDTQKTLGAEVWPDPIELRVRIALHSGSCEERDGDFFGPAVNRVARLAAVAHGGQVLVSGTTAQLLSDTVPKHTSLRDLGAHRLRDLSQPEHVFQLDIAGSDHEFPALRSLDNPTLDNNLPIQLTSFVGRDRELSDVRALVDGSPLVTLTGAGGAGKTRLALAVAADLLDGLGDGVWFVDLASLGDPELVASATANAIGVRDEPGRPVIETLLDALRSRRLLLLFDNCEHLIDGCVKLVDALMRSCPGVHVLATSREPLGLSGERIYRVPPLTLPGDDPLVAESVQLFLERAQEHRPDFVLGEKSVAVLGALCRRLDGMPLAIELAAARVRSLSLEDIESRLDQRFRLLTGGDRGALARQQTLRALIDWSYDLLNERERAILDYLSVFAGGFDLTATETVCALAEIEAWEVVDVLGSLVDKSLVQADQTNRGLRYRLLETIRQYADERLAERGKDALVEARATHAHTYLTLAEEAVPHLSGDRQLEWIDRLDTEQDNIITAIDHFVADPDAGVKALRLVVAASELWNVRSRPDSAQAIAAALAHPGAQTPSALRAAALGELGSRLEGREGRGYLEEGLAIARSVDDRAVLARLLVDLSFVAFLEGDERTCEEAADEAARVAESIRSDRLLAWALQRKAGAIDKRDLDQSTALCRRALGLVRKIGDRRSEEGALTNLALCEAMQGNLDLARESWNDALSISNELGNELGQSIILNCLGDLTLEEGDADLALVDLCRSLRIARRIGSRRFLAYGLLSLAAAASALGLVGQSAMLHGASDALFEELGHPPEAPAARAQQLSLSKLHEAMGEAFDSAYETGRQLQLNAAVELALHLPSNGEP